MLKISIVLLAIGVALLAFSTYASDLEVVGREDVWLTEGGATMASLDVDARGRYQVWVVDEKPGEEDLPFMVFEIDDGDIAVERSDGSVVRNIEGEPHELVGTFWLDGRDSHFYDTWTGGEFTGDISVELIFTESTAWSGRPLLWAGILIFLTGIIVLLVHFLRPSWRGEELC